MDNTLFAPLLLKEETLPSYRFCIYQSSRHQLLSWLCLTSYLLAGTTLLFGLYEWLQPNFSDKWYFWPLYAVLLFFTCLMPYSFIKLQHRYVLEVILLPQQKVSIQTWGLLSYKKQILRRGICHLSTARHIGIPHWGIPAFWLKLQTLEGKTYFLDTEGNFPYGESLLNEVFINNKL